MKWFRRFFLFVVAVSAVGWVGVTFSQNALASKAVLAQRVEANDPELAALTGEVGTPIGEPQRLIIEDQKAFLEGTGKDGARLVSDAYLTEHKIYPLQEKTVNYVGGMVRLGLGIAFVLSFLGWILLGRKGRVSGSSVAAPMV